MLSALVIWFFLCEKSSFDWLLVEMLGNNNIEKKKYVKEKKKKKIQYKKFQL